MNRRLHSIIAIVAVSVFAMAAAQPQIPEQLPTVLPKYAFVSGGDLGIDKLATPWADRMVRWSVLSQAGTLGNGRDRTNEQGRLTLRFEVPDVRVAVHMAMALKPEGLGEEAVDSLDLVVLPKDPFADGQPADVRLLHRRAIQPTHREILSDRCGLQSYHG